MTVSFEGIGANLITFYNASASNAKAAKGGVVKLTAAGTVGKCADGDRFCGLAISAEDDFAGVQTAGYATVKYTGTAPTVGYARLLANGAGGVKVDAASTKTGGEYLVVNVDSVAGTAGIVL